MNNVLNRVLNDVPTDMEKSGLHSVTHLRGENLRKCRKSQTFFLPFQNPLRSEMYLEFKRHSGISLSTGDLAANPPVGNFVILPEGVSTSSLDSARSRNKKPTIDRTIKPMSASLSTVQRDDKSQGICFNRISSRSLIAISLESHVIIIRPHLLALVERLSLC